jgi:dephospho-CoA kinase
MNDLVNTFGDSIIEDGSVSRKKLGNIVFNSKEDMDKLTDITWKYMEEDIDKIIDSNRDKVIILDWQLLPKTKFFNMCDIKILLDVDKNIRRERSINRDNISIEAFDLRDKASVDYNKEDFDYVIDNNDIETARNIFKFDFK